MNYERDVFISYAHFDNTPIPPEEKGWIDRFHASLQVMLTCRLGRKAEIWRDKKLTGNDIFRDEIMAQFPKTALLVSVLTPRYVDSDWCTKELREFCDAAARSGGVVVDNKSRIFKVIKSPVRSETSLPHFVKGANGYDFYTTTERGAPMELDLSQGGKLAEQYKEKLCDLAWELYKLIERLEGSIEEATTAEKAPSRRPIIYLANCSYELRESREALARELRFQEYTVYPARQLPLEEQACVAEISRSLEQCTLSIHLVGAHIGFVPDGPSQKSVAMLENELAVERSRKGSLKRLIWVPEGTQSQHLDQQRFINELHTDPAAQFGAELVTGDLESLKLAVHTALDERKKAAEARPPAKASENSRKLVYLICDKRDRSSTVPLRRFLKAKGLETQIPLFEGEANAVRTANGELLRECDEIVLFYGAGDEAWKRTVEGDLKKIRAFREKPEPPTFLYLAEPATDDKKELIELEESNLINGLAGFSEAHVQPLLNALHQASEGASAGFKP